MAQGGVERRAGRHRMKVMSGPKSKSCMQAEDQGEQGSHEKRGKHGAQN